MGPKELSERTGVSVHTIRYYERAGLLNGVARTRSGQRSYLEKDADRLEFIKKMRATGMGISQIRQYVGLDMRTLSSLQRRRDMLRQHREDLAEQIRVLEECCSFLEFKLGYYNAAVENVTSGKWQESEAEDRWDQYFEESKRKTK